MTKLINIYCDESCHLQNLEIKAENQFMLLGGISCDAASKEDVFTRIKEIKQSHGMGNYSELKWTKASKGKLAAYKDIIHYFFDNPDLSFRAVVINKTQLQHERFNHTHDNFYYKMYWLMLGWFIDNRNKYRVYLDTKDTQGMTKIEELRKILCASHGNGQSGVVERIQEVRSHEIALMQIVDVLIGAIAYANRFPDGGQSDAKNQLVDLIKRKTGLSLRTSTFLGTRKFNLFHWEGH